MGGAVSNAGNLRRWGERELRIIGAEQNILNRKVAANDKLIVLPFWVAERAPTWPEEFRGTIFGVTQSTTAAEIFRATTCAVFYRLAEILARIEKGRSRATEVIVSGGVAHSARRFVDDEADAVVVAVARQRLLMRGEEGVMRALEDDFAGHGAEVVDDHGASPVDVEQMPDRPRREDAAGRLLLQESCGAEPGSEGDRGRAGGVLHPEHELDGGDDGDGREGDEAEIAPRDRRRAERAGDGQERDADAPEPPRGDGEQ